MMKGEMHMIKAKHLMTIDVEGSLQSFDMSSVSVLDMIKLQEQHHFDVVSYSRTEEVKGVK